MSQDIRTVLISLYGIENGGIRQLSAVLKADRRQVCTVFFKNWRNNDVRPPSPADVRALLDLLAELRPDVVGLGFGTPYFKVAVDLTLRIRAGLGPLIVWGGIHATAVPENCIALADAVCVGEGEAPLREFIGRLAAGRGVDDVANFWVRTRAGQRRNALGELCQDLDALPYRDFEDEGKFYVDDGRVFPGDPILKIADLRVSASRGCPLSCTTATTASCAPSTPAGARTSGVAESGT
jgi:radical SAM superfamily enzyme YgiQ (UPF0313 family)